MTERRKYDVPAALIAAALGIALVVVSIPFIPDAYAAYCKKTGNCGASGPGPKEFLVAWSEKPASTTTLSIAGDADAQQATANANGIVLSTVRIRSTRCVDTYDENLQQPAALRWELQRNGTRVDGGEFTCAAPLDQTFNFTGQPDIASAVGASATDARAAMYEDVKLAPTWAGFTLLVEASRPPGQVPIAVPVLETDLQADVAIEVSQWSDTLAPKAPEVPK